MTVVRWTDNKDVFAISTLLGDNNSTAKRHVDGVVKDVPIPEIISDYNQFMGGVDLADQVMCYYSLGRKSLKWWRRVFWRYHDHAIVNAYVLYAINNSSSLDKTMTRKKFRLELARVLSAPAIALRRGPGRKPSQSLSRLSGKHFPYRSAERKRCAVCAYKRVNPREKRYKDKKIMTWCPKCEAHLCIGQCFQSYHTRVDYKR